MKKNTSTAKLFSCQIAADDQAEAEGYWSALVGNGGAANACGWCKDKWGLSWRIMPQPALRQRPISWCQEADGCCLAACGP